MIRKKGIRTVTPISRLEYNVIKPSPEVQICLNCPFSDCTTKTRCKYLVKKLQELRRQKNGKKKP